METDDSTPVTIRPVEPDDLARIAAFIEPFVVSGKLLRRTREELQDLLPHGFVAECEGQIVGFAALEIYSRKLAELRSLAVAEDFRRRGLGRQLVDKCVQRSREQGVLEVMAITSSEDFFRSCGFDFTLPGEKKALFITTRR